MIGGMDTVFPHPTEYERAKLAEEARKRDPKAAKGQDDIVKRQWAEDNL